MKICLYPIAIVLSLLPLFGAAQCTYTTMDYDDFEFTTEDPYLIPGTVYHLSPQTFGPYEGTYGLYMNFVDNLTPGTVVYDRPYEVCPGQTYQISVWLKETWNGSSNVTLNLIDDNNLVLDSWTGIINNFPWINWESNPVIASTGILRFQLISNWNPGSNDLSMDNLELKMCEIPPVSNVNISTCLGNAPFNLHDSLSVLNGTTGSWIGPSATGSGALGSIDPSNAISGNYTYTIPGTAICPDSTEIVNVIISQSADVDAHPDILECQSYTLPAITGNSLSGAQSYYTGPNATGVALAAGEIITTSQVIYIYDGIEPCHDEETFVVTIEPVNNAGTDSDVTLCPNQGSFDLYNGLGGGPDQGGLWIGPSATSNDYLGTIDPGFVNEGTYLYVSSGSGNCPNDTSEVNLSIVTLEEVNLGNDTALCENQTLELSVNIAGASYLWNTGSNASSISVNENGNYELTITTSDNCVLQDNIDVSFIPLPHVDLPNDTIICKESILELNPDLENVTNIMWHDGSEDEDYLVRWDEFISVDVSNQCGTDADSIMVKTRFCDCFVFIPNSFTPDGDGVNDYFYPKVDCEFLESYQMSIFNRWGELIWETTDIEEIWNGDDKSLNDYVHSNFYLWKVTYSAIVNDIKETEELFGQVLLIR